MLEEIITTFLSLFSALTLDAPQVSIQLETSASSPEECNHCSWEDGIYGDDTMFEPDRLLLQVEYKPTYLQSLFRTLKAS